MTIWSIYTAPEGSPAPFVALPWETAAGATPRHGDPVFAASLEKAREVVPGGLVRSDPSKDRREPSELIETWAEAKT